MNSYIKIWLEEQFSIFKTSNEHKRLEISIPTDIYNFQRFNYYKNTLSILLKIKPYLYDNYTMKFDHIINSQFRNDENSLMMYKDFVILKKQE